MSVDQLFDKIINSINKDWNKNEIIRYVYIALGKEFCKDVKFFYSFDRKIEECSYSFETLSEIYDPKNVESFKVICKSAAIVLKNIFEKLGIECELIKTIDSNTFFDRETLRILDVHHWFVCVTGEENKKFFLTLVPDLMNIQFNMPTEHFANNIDYKREINGKMVQIYEGDEINISTMSNQELIELDEKIGYIKPYYTSDKDGNVIKLSEYDDVFLSYVSTFIRKDGYMYERAYDTDFYKKALSFEIDGIKIEEYLNNGNISDDKLSNWFNYLREMVNERFDVSDDEYSDCMGKINGLSAVIKNKKYKQYRMLLGRLAMAFVDKKYKRDKNGMCSYEYVKNKFEYLFPLMMGCNEKNIKPITKNFKGFSEQIEFIDLFLKQMFIELREKNANNCVSMDSDESILKNRIQRYSIYNKNEDNYKVIFSIDKKDIYYYFDPSNGEFKKIGDLLNLISDGYIIISGELKRQMMNIENIEQIEQKKNI